ncbi:hypothetical protein CYR55_21100 [Chimaeribacter californicus]|uniref:Uncharacterized protein n=1 Tax=Chimaeribacter californicus TaxID=2060067 RepID=A0A2N5DVN3_9GAMM|nr:hypothetical protein CYR55_21100 [Chimaeribacter californicus]
MRLWVRAPRTSILSIHISRIKHDLSLCRSLVSGAGCDDAPEEKAGGTESTKRIIMTQKNLNGYPV